MERYPGGFWIDPERRRIPDHWHARPSRGRLLRSHQRPLRPLRLTLTCPRPRRPSEASMSQCLRRSRPFGRIRGRTATMVLASSECGQGVGGERPSARWSRLPRRMREPDQCRREAAARRVPKLGNPPVRRSRSAVRRPPVRARCAGSPANPHEQGFAAATRSEPGREHDRLHHPRDDHAPVLERLTQTFDRVAAELGELVEEQDTVVRQGSSMSPEVVRGELYEFPASSMPISTEGTSHALLARRRGRPMQARCHAARGRRVWRPTGPRPVGIRWDGIHGPGLQRARADSPALDAAAAPLPVPCPLANVRGGE